MNKCNLIIFIFLGIVFTSCSQKEENIVKISNSINTDSIYNSVINPSFIDAIDTLTLSDILLNQKISVDCDFYRSVNFGFYRIDTINFDSISLGNIHIYLKVLHMDSCLTKNEMMFNWDSRKITFYLYDDVLSYTDDYNKNMQIELYDINRIINDYYFADSLHLKFPIYNRDKGVEVKYHISANEYKLEKLLFNLGLSYIQVINNYCELHFNNNITDISKNELSIIKDSLHFNTLISISRSQTGSFNM